MKIDKFDFTDNLVLAPMAGVSDVGFRYLCSKYGASATFSEMLSCRAMLNNPKKTEYMTQSTEEEKIKIGQIFGHEEDIMVQALKSPLLQNYDIIDINIGCPAPKIVKNGEGSALMKDILKAKSIISSIVKASEKPVSVKFRLGYDRDISLAFGRMCEESGASFITLHGRTATQGYSGHVNLEAIAKLKAGVKIPVIGNGDVSDVKSYKDMLATNVDAVMIGRGAQGRPWIFAQLLGKGGNISAEEKLSAIKTHVEILRRHYDESWLTLYLRKHFLWYTSQLPNAAKKRALLATSPSIENSMEIIEELFCK